MFQSFHRLVYHFILLFSPPEIAIGPSRMIGVSHLTIRLLPSSRYASCCGFGLTI